MKAILSIILLLSAATPVVAQDMRVQKICGNLVPPRPAFDDLTQKLWYNRFWTGACAPGLAWCQAGSPNWIETEAQLEASVPVAKRQAYRNRLCKLGYRVGLEWSRDNSVRQLNTNDLYGIYAMLNDTAVSPEVRLATVERRVNLLLGK